ncbi:MAG TPA: glycosyltransferase [Gemmatimonadales bacterium]|nr:glycosyltransferase [Gemmatimonadales bacterium]
MVNARSPLKLAVFTSTYPARVATFFERDMRALLEAGVEIDVFAVAPLNRRLWRYRLELLGEDVLPRDRLHHLSLLATLRQAGTWPWRRLAGFARDAAAVTVAAARYGPMPLAKSVYVFPKALAWAGVHAGRYDHVLAYWGNYAGTCAYLFHRLIARPQRPIPFSIWLHAGTDLYRSPVYLRQKLRYADAIITCCEFNRRFLEEQYADDFAAIGPKVFVSYHGLDLAGFPYRPDGRPPRTVLAVGRFAPEKGFDHLVRAVAALNARGAPVDLELVGDGPERSTLADLARELGLAARVRFRGWLPFTQVREAMSQATVLVHPSPGLGDGLPNVLREAMAVGTPVVATRVAGMPEALDDGRCGVLVPPGDVPALTDAIAGLLADSARRREFALLGRRRTEQLFDAWRNGVRLAEHLRTVERTQGNGVVVPC